MVKVTALVILVAVTVVRIAVAVKLVIAVAVNTDLSDDDISNSTVITHAHVLKECLEHFLLLTRSIVSLCSSIANLATVDSRSVAGHTKSRAKEAIQTTLPAACTKELNATENFSC
jgi:hypothetical protein